MPRPPKDSPQEADDWLTAADRQLLPGPEPVLMQPASWPGAGPKRILRVCEPLLAGNERKYLEECLETNWISSAGRFVPEFESRFSAAVGCTYGVACSSGTAALHLALAALGIGPGDEVIIPAFTMIAVPNAVMYTGAEPVLVDAEPVYWNLDPQQVLSKITTRTKAIIAVHTYGHPTDLDSIVRIAQQADLYLIEDAAEAHGARWRGLPVGGFGDAACFSFYGNKIVTTGEGGMLTTNDPYIGRLARTLRDHAFSSDRHFWHRHIGFNYRMSNMQAAIGLAQTEQLETLVGLRRRNARLYETYLSSVRGLRLPAEHQEARSVFWMYSLLVEDDFGCSRDDLRMYLGSRGIETRSFYVPIHLQPSYRERYTNQHYPTAEELCRKGLYLPSSPTLSEEEIAYVAEQVNNCRSLQ